MVVIGAMFVMDVTFGMGVMSGMGVTFEIDYLIIFFVYICYFFELTVRIASCCLDCGKR
jgi:hypothetical protein